MPNLTFGPPVLACLRRALPSAFLDCHLMVNKPLDYVPLLAKAGASGFTFHLDATSAPRAAQRHRAAHSPPPGEPAEVARAAREAGMRVGLALSPGTPAEAVFPLADAGLVDLLLVMTVTPGFGGQPFQESELAKVRVLRERYPLLDLQVDGGLAPGRTVQLAAAAGANVVVAGSAVFGAPEPAAAIAALRAALQAGGGS